LLTFASRLAARRLVGIAMFERGASQSEVARSLGVTLDRAHGLSGKELTTLGARQIIERACGVRYCASSARSILHRLGFSYSRKQGWRRRAQAQRPPGALEPRRRAS
jgi:transposase